MLTSRQFTHRNASAPRGFTLVELMVAMVVMGIALTFTIPTLARSAQMHKLRSAASEVQTAFARARSTAVTHKATVRLDFFGGGSQLYIVREDKDNDGVYDSWTGGGHIPNGVQITNLDFGGNNFVSFAPSGTPSVGGSIILGAASQQREIRLAPGSGAATISEPAGTQTAMN